MLSIRHASITTFIIVLVIILSADLAEDGRGSSDRQTYRSLPRLVCANCSTDFLTGANGIALRPTSGTPNSFEHSYGTDNIYSYISPSGHFKLWYVRETADAVPLASTDGDNIPDWVQTGAETFDNAWEFQIENRGFASPPGDSLYAPPGTPAIEYGYDGLFDIYFLDLSSHIISGLTQSEDRTSTHPLYPAGYTSYIVIENDFASKEEHERETYLRITASHEFHHAVQYGYSSDFRRWWMEASAVFIEDLTFPDMNSYIPYVNVFLQHPELPLWKRGNSREYGAAIWPQFLAENYSQGNPDIIREIYDLTASSPGSVDFFTIIDEILTESYDETFREAFGKFTAWNYFTGSRDDGEHYRDSQVFREVDLLGIFSYPPGLERNGELSKLPQGSGSNYIQFDNLNSIQSGNFRIQFDGETTIEWHVQLIIITNTGYHYLSQISLDEVTNSGAIIFEHPNLIDKIIMIPSVISSYAPGLNYSYFAERVDADIDVYDSITVRSNIIITDISTFPNPFRLRTEFFIGFSNEVTTFSQPMSIKIYNAAGQRVKTLLNNDVKPIPLFWDGSNDRGQRLSAGVYFYQFKAGNQSLEGKMTLLP